MFSGCIKWEAFARNEIKIIIIKNNTKCRVNKVFKMLKLQKSIVLFFFRFSVTDTDDLQDREGIILLFF